MALWPANTCHFQLFSPLSHHFIVNVFVSKVKLIFIVDLL